MQDTAKLSDLAKAEIDDLLAQGIAPTPEDVVRINALAWNVENPDTRLALSKGVPVSVGGAVLWPMTMQAYDWLCRILESVNTTKDELSVTAYAMAHCYADGDHYTHAGRHGLRNATTWAKSLRCRPDGLTEAIAQVIRQDETEQGILDEDAKPLGLGDLSASLSAMTGQAPETIESGMSMSHALRVLHYTMQAQERAEGGAGRGHAYVRAEQALGLYLVGVKERANGEA